MKQNSQRARWTSRRCVRLMGAITLAAALSGCAGVAERNVGALVVTAVAAHLPTAQIQQVYYLGVFDPREQVPPTLYRVRVRGQSSALNTSTKFASGWVHSYLMDSLSSSRNFDGTVQDLGGGNRGASDRGLLTGRRLIMFGPEGFREAPKDHRLVVVMGADPAGFFAAIDSALGSVAEVTQGTTVGPEVSGAILAELSRLRSESRRLDDLVNGLNADDAGGAK